MDKEALKLTLLHQLKFLRGYVSDLRYDVLDGLEGLLKLLVAILRFILLPVVVIYVAMYFRSHYQQIKTDSKIREQIKKYVGN